MSRQASRRTGRWSAGPRRALLLPLVLLSVAIGLGEARAADPAGEALADVRRGHALLRQENVEGACAAFGRAAARLPSWWIAHYERARCGRILGDPYDTLSLHAREAVRFAPANAVVWELLGFIQEDAGRDDEAALAYGEALARDSRLYRAALRLGRLEIGRRQFESAAERFRGVLVWRPGLVQAWSGLAEAADGAGRRGEAEEALLRMAALSNYPAKVYARLVDFYRRHGARSAARAAERAWRQAAVGREVKPTPKQKFRKKSDR